VDIEIESFLHFFSNPVQAFMQQRLHLFLDEQVEEWPDRELFSLHGLDRYRLCDDLVQEELADATADAHDLDRYQLHLAKGELPEGPAGRLSFQYNATLASGFAARLRELRGENKSLPALPVYLAIDRQLGCQRLNGRLQVWPTGQYLFRPTSVRNFKYRDVVRYWLLHLLLNAASADTPRQTFLIGLDGGFRLDPLEEAGDLLMGLGVWYNSGLTEPLPLLPRASFIYASKLWGSKAIDDPESRQQALQAAAAAWHDVPYAANGPELPEKQSPYLNTAFGDRDPLEDPRFHDLAALLLGQPLSRMVKIKMEG
jgi:exonuclease V gamma subunit